MKSDVNKRSRGRPKAGRRLKRVNVSVDPEDYEALERLAIANRMSSALLIRIAMRDFLRTNRGRGAMVALEQRQ